MESDGRGGDVGDGKDAVGDLGESSCARVKVLYNFFFDGMMLGMTRMGSEGLA